MTGEEVFNKWKHKAPKGATHGLIIPEREGICWFVGKDFHQACREFGLFEFVYRDGLDAMRKKSGERNQKLIPINISLENK